jgi:sialic acid synthase SpsE
LISKNPLNKRPFFVAEISANHNGSLLHAKKLIKIAKKLGKEKIELLSVANPDTIRFYKRMLFKKVKSSNTFAKEGTRKRLIAFRRRITRKKPAAAAAASN